MKFRRKIPFLLLTILFLLSLPFGFNIATSVVPGSHGLILSPFFIGSIVISVTMLVAVLIYLARTKQIEKANWRVLILYFILTVPIILFLRFPSLFRYPQWRNFDEFERQNKLLTITVILFLVPFLVGQLIFGVYLFRQKKPQA
jgi:hypothetical protein